jgi:hypothetical protein
MRRGVDPGVGASRTRLTAPGALRRRALAAAIRDIRAARRAAPGEWLGERGVVALLGVRHGAARLVARHPRLVRPAVAAWRVLRRVDRFG